MPRNLEDTKNHEDLIIKNRWPINDCFTKHISMFWRGVDVNISGTAIHIFYSKEAVLCLLLVLKSNVSEVFSSECSA